MKLSAPSVPVSRSHSRAAAADGNAPKDVAHGVINAKDLDGMVAEIFTAETFPLSSQDFEVSLFSLHVVCYFFRTCNQKLTIFP